MKHFQEKCYEKSKNQMSLFVMLMMAFAFVSSCRAQVATDMQKAQTNLAGEGVVGSIRSMTAKRAAHTSTLLDDGKVLITGGHQGTRANVTIYTSAEIYNPANGTFTAAGNLTVKRHKHDATKLADGRVLIVGGSDERDGDAFEERSCFNYERLYGRNHC